MRVLGIDPGSRTTGWGIVTEERGRYVHVASGAVCAVEDAPLSDRVLVIHQGLVEVLRLHTPEVVAVEAIFHHKSVLSALKLGHARGVALLAAAQAGLPVVEYPPALVKQAVSGYGRADKDQVAHMVGLLLGVKVEGPADVTDALAVAITHLAQARTRALRTAATGTPGRNR